MTSRTRATDADLIKAVRAFIGRGDYIDGLAGDAWRHAAVEHGVLAPVAEVVSASGSDSTLDIRQLRQSRVARQLRTAADLTIVRDALNEAGIDWAVLKGPVLTDEVFQRRGVRDYVDLDVLVGPQSLRHSLKILQSAGARVLNVAWNSVEWSKAAEVPVALPHGTTLDLHWSMINRLAVRRTYPDLTKSSLRRRQTVQVLGMSVPTLGDLDFTAHVILHGCLDGAAKLRNLLDAHQCVIWLRERGHSPADLRDRVRQGAAQVAVGSVLHRVSDHLDNSVAEWAETVGKRNTWSRVMDASDRSASRGAVSSSLGRKMHRHTCPNTVLSLSAVLERQTVRARETWESKAHPETRQSTEEQLSDWLSYVERQ